MFKRFSILFLLFLSSVLNAQTNVTYSSTSFPEPNVGWNKIIMLKNGNTVYIHANPSTMLVRVYDKERKEINNQNIPYKSLIKGGMPGKEQIVKAAYEQNGNIVLFVSGKDGCGLGGYINCVQSLYRFVIDPATAKIVNGEKLGETEKVRSWGYNLSEITVNDIFISKDPVSDIYAVLVFNGYTETKDKPDRITLMTYDGNNQPLKTIVLNAPSTGDKAVHFAGMCMYDKTVYLGTNMYNAKEKGLNVPLCISVLKNGADTFVTKTYNISPFAIKSDNQLVFHPGLQNLLILTTTPLGKDLSSGFPSTNSEMTHDHSSGISWVNPTTMDIVSTKGINLSKADAYYKQKLGEKNGFQGTPSSVYINSNNTLTVLLERHYTASTSNSSRESITTNTYVGRIGLIKLDKDANAIESMVLRLRGVSGAMMSGSAADYYFDYKYFNTSKASYIVLNDLEENFDKPQTDQHHIMTTASDGNTILYKITNGRIEKSYLWGAPEKKNSNRFAMIGNSTYDEATNTWATIVVNGSDKKARVAWVTLE